MNKDFYDRSSFGFLCKENIFLVIMMFFAIALEAKRNINVKYSQKILNRVLADHGVLLFQTLNYHWNLEGKEFHDYHILFDKLYKQLFEDLDLVAERIRAVDGKALGSMQTFIKNSGLKEDIDQTPQPQQMVMNLFGQYEKMIRNIRSSIKKLEKKSDDFATRKMLEDLLEQHEKSAWMLRSLTK